MFKEDFVQTHKDKKQEDSASMQSDEMSIQFLKQSNTPINDQPQQTTTNDRKLHGYKSAIKRSRYRNRNSLLQLSKRKSRIHRWTLPQSHERHRTPPRLAFINAVRSAWALHSKKRLSMSSPKRLVKPRHLECEQKEPVFEESPYLCPAITAAALDELSVPQLFSCLQIRHDLLMDPNLSFRPNMTPQKRRNNEHFWQHLDKLIKTRDTLQLIRPVRTLTKELMFILISLIEPFPKDPRSSVVWKWPSHITEEDIWETLNSDFISQQLVHGSLNVESQLNFVISIISPLCPKKAERIQVFVRAQEYAKALQEIFETLEAIKLDVANEALRYYRPYLIHTGTIAEWNLFYPQLLKGEIDVCSTLEWLIYTWQIVGKATLNQTLHAGVILILTYDRHLTDYPSPPFPITFKYDEKRLKKDMRHEFQNIVTLALLLMPYRLIAGTHSRKEDIDYLKESYAKMLKEACKPGGRVCCANLAIQACVLANRVNPKKKNDDMVTFAQYWSDWLDQNLRYSSPVYCILHDRVKSKLMEALNRNFMEYPSSHALIGLEPEIEKLNKKIVTMVDYNERTYSRLYYNLGARQHANTTLNTS